MNSRSGISKTKTCVLLLKSKTRWAPQLIQKLALQFSVHTVYAAPHLTATGVTGLLKTVNDEIEMREANCIFIAVDFFPSIDVHFIGKISDSVKKVLITFDDCVLHSFNSVSASACDLVLSADPISVLRYREKGIPSEYCPLESSAETYKADQTQEKIGILFFGVRRKGSRAKYLDYLEKRNIHVKVIGDDSKFFVLADLVQEISKAKIVLNFSETDRLTPEISDLHHSFKTLLQFKGRIIETGLCGTACVSEYSPAIPLLFNEHEVPMFRNPKECAEVLTHLIGDVDKLKDVTDALHRAVKEKYEDSVVMEKVKKALQEVDSGQKAKRSITVPPSYTRLVTKARLRHVYNKPLEIVRELTEGWVTSRPASLLSRTRNLFEATIWFACFYLKERLWKRLKGEARL